MLGARSGLDASEEAVKKAAQDAGRWPPQVLKITLDVTNPASVAQAAAEVETSAGRLDILVNNAGYIDMTLIKDSDPETWWRVWEVNVKGPYLIARAFLPLMLKAEDSLKQVVTVARYDSTSRTSTLTKLTMHQCRCPPHNTFSVGIPTIQVGSPPLYAIHRQRV